MSCLERKNNSGENALILDDLGVLDEQLPSHPIIFKLRSIPQLELTKGEGKNTDFWRVGACFTSKSPPGARVIQEGFLDCTVITQAKCSG